MRYYRNHADNSLPPGLKYIIIANMVVFVAQLALDKTMYLTGRLALYPIGHPDFRAYQVITHMFTHADARHIIFNMLSLWIFGRLMESRLGTKRFLNFYLLSGLGAALLHLLVQYLLGDGVPTIGASGAVMGVVVGFATLFPNTEMMDFFIPIPIKAKWIAIGYVAVDLFSGIANVPGDNVAHFAHLGGALTGFLLVRIWNKTDRRNFY